MMQRKVRKVSGLDSVWLQDRVSFHATLVLYLQDEGG